MERSGAGSGWVRARAPGSTANLGPGFDALGLALEWTEEVHARLLPAGLAVCVQGPGAADVPADERNLAVRGARAVLEAAGRGEAGLELRLRLRLPVGRGLGSSAAAVVAGMVAANRLLGEPLPAERLLAIGTAIEGHPDNVAPALLGGFCVACRPRGATGPAGDASAPAPPDASAAPGVLALRLPPPPGVAAVVAVPERPLRTHEARAVLPEAVPFADAVANVQRACLLVGAVAAGRTDLLDEATRDCLHQPYRARLVPGLEEALAAARTAGAYCAFLSGAGPSVLALVRADGRAGAAVRAALEEALPRMGGGTVRVLALSGRGAVAEPAPPPAGCT